MEADSKASRPLYLEGVVWDARGGAIFDMF